MIKECATVSLFNISTSCLIVVIGGRKEIEIFEAILNSDKDISKYFQELYINHPYYKLINEIKELCQRKKK